MDSIFNKINDVIFEFASSKDNTEVKAPYGRGVEQASGLGLLLVAYTLLFGNAFQNIEVFFITPVLWAWMAAVLGICQLLYRSVSQRMVFTLSSASFWLTLAIYSYVNVMSWNLATAASMPFVLFNFYIYGFVWNKWKETRENKQGVTEYLA